MDTVVRDPYREALEAATGLTLRELFHRRRPDAYPSFERGELTEREYWDAYAEAGVAVDVEAFHATRRRGYEWLPGMRELLDDLAGRVQRIAASNYPLWVDELADGMLAGRFERILASHHLGARKPGREFFEMLLAELRVPGDQVLFVDDRDENVDGALRAGLAAHRYAGADDLRARLRAEGVDV